MKIGIIGAGYIGGTLARLWTRHGHEVRIANSRGPDTLGDLARETGARAVTTAEAVQGVEVIVITIPQKAVPALPRDLFASVPGDVLVLDTNNYYPSRDGRLEGIEQAASESVWVSEQIGRPVIKVFNSIGFQSLLEKGAPKGTPGRVALPVAGDDATAKGKALALVDELGFEPIDAGTLADSWRQQPGTPVYVRDLDEPRTREALAGADHARIADYRHAADEAAKAYFGA
ncbi:MAG: NADP oxidoreductase [Myxococcales bacterium]|nr:MAG: NADP oxidoreductase [Myxococcales bacterium]